MKIDGLAYLLITIAYVATGKLGMLLSLPPGYASPIFLPAGIAIAAALIGGRKALPWIFLGSLLLNIWIGYSASQQVDVMGLAVATLIAIASLLQAAVGGWGLRRMIGYPASFDHKDKFLRFLMLAPFICLVSASLSVSSLWLLGIVEGASFVANWGAWWFGDTLGVLVMLPLIMTVVDAPSSDRQTRLHTVIVPVLLVLSIGFVAVYFLQQAAFNSARKAQQDSFEYQASEITLRIEQRLATYEQVLRGAKGLFAASRSVERDEFSDYMATQNLAVRYPGIQGVGFSPIVTLHEKSRHIESMRKQGFSDYRIWPEGERKLYTPIIYLEPLAGSNSRALGYDVYSDSVRSIAMKQARDQDKTIMSGKLRLVQETGVDEQPGFLMYLPVFRNGSPHASEAERRANVIGWVSAPFRMKDLMQGLLGDQIHHLDLEIYDGEGATSAAQMYDSNSPQSQNFTPLYSTYRSISIMGHKWIVRLHSLPKFEAGLNTTQVTIVRFSGISITLLLAVLVWQLAIGRTRALNLAQEMTRELRESSARVEMLLHSVAEGIYGVDMQGNCTFINSAGLALLGYQNEGELLGKNMHNMIHHTRPDGFHYPVTECRLYHSMQSRENVHVSDEVFWRKDGSSFQVDYWSRPTMLNGEFGAVITFLDITQSKQAQDAMRASEAKLRGLYELSPLGIALTDMNGKFVEFNDSFLRICGYTEEELRSLDYWVLTPKKYEVDEARQLESLAKTGRYGPYEKEYMRKDGKLVPLRLNGVLMTGRDGKQYIWSIVEDVTASKQAEASLRKLSLAVEQSPNSIVITDLQANIEFVNDAFTKTTGYTFEEAIGKNPRLLKSGKTPSSTYAAMWSSLLREEKWEGELINRSKDGKEYIESVRISPVRQANGHVTHYVAVKEDITMRKLAEEQIRNLAFYDALTQLPNRRLLDDRLGQSMAASKRNGLYGALMFLDLDNFKTLNDTYGHSVGDLLLIEAAHRINECVRESDTVARLGGDEFVVMLNELDMDEAASITQAGIVAEKIRHALSLPYLLHMPETDGTTVTVEHHCAASIGVALFIDHEASQQDILKRADMAMYQAKEGGRNQIRFYEDKKV